MPTTSPPSLLDRELSKADAREKIDLVVPLLDEIVNNGLAELMRSCTEAGGSALKAEDEAILSLFRHAIDAIDGIRALLAEASVEPCQVLLRTEFEAAISLLFIADSPTAAVRTPRGQACVVADLRKQLVELKRLDPASQGGKPALSKLAKVEARLAEADGAVSVFDKVERGEMLCRAERWRVSFFVAFAETRAPGYRENARTRRRMPEPTDAAFEENAVAAFRDVTGLWLEPWMIEKVARENLADIASDSVTSA